MEDIIVMEKPDWVSWDDIHELLLAAHKKNEKKGMFMRVPHLPPEQLPKEIGEEGHCFVALEGRKLVGTTSVRFYCGHSWYDRGHFVAHSMLSAILPKYQGIGITDDLNVLRDAYIRKKGADMIHADTAEDNIIVRENAKRNGFIEVGYFAPKSHHYNVIFVKWLNGCPFPNKYINKRLKWSERLTKRCFKPGKAGRFTGARFFYHLSNMVLDFLF